MHFEKPIQLLCYVNHDTVQKNVLLLWIKHNRGKVMALPKRIIGKINGIMWAFLVHLLLLARDERSRPCGYTWIG